MIAYFVHKNENLMDMIKLIEKELNKKAIIEFHPMQLGDVLESHANIDHSINKLKYQPSVSISEGIPNFVDWYKKYIGP